MPERPDLRQIAASLRQSLDLLDRDQLVDILTYVLNEYVVEGPPPLAVDQVERLEDLAGLNLARLVTALQTRLDTAGLELFRVEGDQVAVQTGQGWVVLAPGRPAAVAAATDRPAAAPQPATGAASADPAATPAPPVQARPDGRAGLRFEEQPMPRRSAAPERGRAAVDEARARGRGDLVGGRPGVITPPPPRPRGLSVTGRPVGGAGAPPRSGAAGAPRAPGAPGAAPPAPAPASAPPAGADPAAGRGEGTPPDAAEPAASPSGERTDDASIRFSLLELD